MNTMPTGEQSRRWLSWKRSQTSLEVIMILALMLGVFIIIIVSNNSVLSLTGSRVDSAQANQALDEVVDAATQAYQQGAGAKTRVLVTIPNSVWNASVDNRTLTLNLYGKAGQAQSFYRVAGFQINGTFPNTSGRHWVDVEAFSSYVNISYG